MQLALLALVAAMVGACATTARQMTFQELESHVGDLASVSVTGCVVITELGAHALFKDCDAAKAGNPDDAVDLGFGAHEGPLVASGNYVCLLVTGRYYDLDGQSIVTGPTFGTVGMFGATKWEVVDCEDERSTKEDGGN